MKTRETIFGNKSLDRFDAIVIGSGPSGSACTAMLCKLGKKVLLLEGGPNLFDGIDNPASGYPISRIGNDGLSLGRGLTYLDGRLSPRSYRRDPADGVRIKFGPLFELPRGVGGGSMLADVRLPRFAPDDFRVGTLLTPTLSGTSFVDWPISYDELEPFYTYAEQSYGVQGEPDPNGGRRSAPYPMAPGPAKYGSILLAEQARKLGYKPFRCPRGLNSRPYDGRPACINCGFCGGHGCPVNARGGCTPITSLRRALLSGNCLLLAETKVAKLKVSGTGKQVIGVEAIHRDGRRAEYKADLYILATGAIEDTRIVLRSVPGGIGNPNDLVGRNFCGRSVIVAVGIYEERIHQDRGNGPSFSLSDFRALPTDGSRPLGGLVTLGGEQTPMSEIDLYLGALKIQPGSIMKKALRQGIGRERMAYITMYGEDPPQLRNRVDLDPDLKDLDGLPSARITYRRHASVVNAASYYGPKLLEILQGGGARYGAVLPLDDLSAQCGHHAGTLRFGKDPLTSVCDPSGRFHAMDNLYGSGGSLFPSLPGCNPTMTMAALSLRIAAGIVYPGSPERALQTPV